MAEEKFMKLVEYAVKVTSGLAALNVQDFAQLYSEYIASLPEHLQKSYIVILTADGPIVVQRCQLPELISRSPEIADRLLKDLARYKEVTEHSKQILSKLGW
ncbi:MAG: hypothetical protein QXJ59_01710 [Thermofilaceae archaeon]